MIPQLERRLGVALLERNRRGVSLTGAGEILQQEDRAALDAATAAVRRTRRAASSESPGERLVLAVKAGAFHELLNKILDAYAAEPDAAAIEVLPSGMCEQEGMLRDGRADAALMRAPFNPLAGFDSVELMTEGAGRDPAGEASTGCAQVVVHGRHRRSSGRSLAPARRLCPLAPARRSTIRRSWLN